MSASVSDFPGEIPTGSGNRPRLSWWPQPGPQSALFYCNVEDILFGGSRGGGKTDGVLGRWGFRAHLLGSAFNAVLFRQTMPSQDDIWDRARQIYGAVGADLHEHTHTVRFREGGRIRFRPLERLSDADKYQGQNLSDIWVEEAGLYHDPAPLDRLWGALRGNIAVSYILTGNPGGAGQHWIKERYITPWRPGNRVMHVILPNGATHRRIFIPSFIEDNKILLQNDPQYVNRLYLVGNAKLVDAWLKGDWDAVEGAFFEEWNPRLHVCEPFKIPEDWIRYCSCDWGTAKPFSIGWHAIVPEEFKTPDGHTLPRGCAVRYREWYGKRGINKGVKMTVEEVAQGIKEREGWVEQGGTLVPGKEKMRLRVIDPRCFANDGGPTHAERFSREGIHFQAADNTRVSGDGRMLGWDLVRARLKGIDGLPMLVVFATCTDLIRTLPVAQHDADRPEDLDTDTEDHALDEERYFCAARPWMPPAAKEAVDKRRPTDRYAKPRERSWREY